MNSDSQFAIIAKHHATGDRQRMSLAYEDAFRFIVDEQGEYSNQELYRLFDWIELCKEDVESRAAIIRFADYCYTSIEKGEASGNLLDFSIQLFENLGCSIMLLALACEIVASNGEVANKIVDRVEICQEVSPLHRMMKASWLITDTKLHQLSSEIERRVKGVHSPCVNDFWSRMTKVLAAELARK